jgi:hypothetical protein
MHGQHYIYTLFFCLSFLPEVRELKLLQDTQPIVGF